MKRDMELIKKILIAIEENHDELDQYELQPKEWPQYQASDLTNHASLIIDRGLAKGKVYDGGIVIFGGLTWDGHDFLDNARNSEIWNATKKAAGKLSFGVFQEVLKATATDYALSLLKGVFN